MHCSSLIRRIQFIKHHWNVLHLIYCVGTSMTLLSCNLRLGTLLKISIYHRYNVLTWINIINIPQERELDMPIVNSMYNSYKYVYNDVVGTLYLSFVGISSENSLQISHTTLCIHISACVRILKKPYYRHAKKS